ncbi:MAG: VWA domain-containing protein [Candidatus Thorarchaeota archaeon]
MKVDTRYLLLSGIGIIILVSTMLMPSTLVNNQNALLGEPASSVKLGSMIPDDVTIEGKIIDSYVDILYVMRFDNRASEESSEINWLFELQEGIRLSNVSIEIGEITYWGRVIPEQAAIQEYSAAVEEGETALLVVRSEEGYRVRFNLENRTEACVSVRVEGLLARKLGLYSLDLPISRGVPIDTNVILDLSIQSNFEAIAGYSVRGLPSFTATDLTDGIQIDYSSSGVIRVDNFEIRYTLNRQMDGSQLLTYTNGTDNFFVYLLAPSITEIADGAHRQYVFVLDKSGSMGGEKIEQAQAAFNSMIETLLPSDLFNVVAFDTYVTTLWVEPHSASETSVEEAQTWVSNIQPGGSTNFHGAMMTGLEMMREGDYVKALLMLSDGQPTAGDVTTTGEILAAVENANDIGVSVSTVAFGSDSDENLMANLAAQHDGFFVFIQPSSDAATELVQFYYEFATPIAESYSIEFDGIIDRSTLMPLNESPFFNGSEIVVCGRYETSMSVNTTIEYPDGKEIYSNTATTPSTENEHVEKIWAQHRITYLLRMIHLDGETPSLRDEIVNLGMNYGIIVEGYTALLITTDEPEVPTTSEPSTDTDPIYAPTQPPAATAATCTDAAADTPGPAFASAAGLDPLLIGLVPGFVLGLLGLVALFFWRRRT